MTGFSIAILSVIIYVSRSFFYNPQIKIIVWCNGGIQQYKMLHIRVTYILICNCSKETGASKVQGTNYCGGKGT